MPRKKDKQSGKGIYDWTANKLFNAKLRVGEIHPPLYTPQGFKFGSYIGPNTKIYDRLREGVEPVSMVDKVAQAHDIRYGQAKNSDHVRDADLKMIAKLDELWRTKGDYKFNILTGSLPIKLKMWAEDHGILNKGSFASVGKNKLSVEDDRIAKSKLSDLEQQGFGKKNWMVHVASVRKSNPSKSYKDCLKIASKSYKK